MNEKQLSLPALLPEDAPSPASEPVVRNPALDWRPSGFPVSAYWPSDFLLGRSEIEIAFVGEAPGEEEVNKGEPFVGSAGRELTNICRDAGIARSACLITNVFRHRPDGNAIDNFCQSRKEVLAYAPEYHLPPLRAGKYVRPQLTGEIGRLAAELQRAKPKIVVALGNTALWALTGRTGIGRIRGTIVESSIVPGLKVLPTYHPAAVLREWSLRAIVVADLLKAKYEATFPEIRRPKRMLWLEPTLADLWKFSRSYILVPETGEVLAPSLSVDIETLPRQRILECLVVSPTRALGIVVPFYDTTKPDHCYWSAEDEVGVWRWLVYHLCHPEIVVGGQNYLYDFHWIFDAFGISTRYYWDLLYKHHSLYLELPKKLDFIASLHTSEPAWKLDRPKGLKTGKRED